MWSHIKACTCLGSTTVHLKAESSLTDMSATAVTKACELLHREGFDKDVVDVFRQNKITVALLENLDGDDFKELGISALGDRKRLKYLIEKLKSSASGSSASFSVQELVRKLWYT